MMRSSLVCAVALVGSLVAQSPCETAWYNIVNPASTTGALFGNLYYSATVQPITQLYDVTFNQDLILTQVDLSTGAQYGYNGELNVFLTAVGGTHVGNQTNAAAWTQVAHLTKVHTAGTVAWVFNPPIAVTAGTYGMAVQTIGASPLYHGGAESPLLPQNYSTTEMTIDVSAARVRGSTAVDAFGGTAAGNAPRQPVHRWHYSTDVRVCDFTGTPTRGLSPLPVQFSPIAASSVPGGILVYQWDFGDGSPLDNSVSPLHTYTTCGNYTVSLQIADAAGTILTSKTDYVVTDVLTPSFTYSLLGGTAVQFQGATAPVAPGATWSWDLDGDGILGDDTTSAPTWVYANVGDEINVTMEVTYGCQGPFTVTKKIVVAQILESTFQSGLITVGGATNSANFLDVNVANPKGITVGSMHVNSSMAVGSPVTVNIYQTEGTYVGKETNASLWRLVGTATATSLGTGGRTLAVFNPPIHLATGSYGLCMEHLGSSPVYTNLGGTQVYSNSDLTMTLGASQTTVFDPASNLFSPRIANLALYYTTTQTNSTAGYGYVGSGCAGTLGVPTNVALSQPTLGGAATVQIDNLPFGIGVAAIGFTRIPPLDLVIIGMGGCNLHHSADATVTLIGAGNVASYSLNVPNNPTLIGAQLYHSALSLDPAINAFGFTLSDAAVMLLGM